MAGSEQTGHSTPSIEGTYIFDHTQSRRGYRLNKMCMSLVQPGNRAEFEKDPRAYMKRWEVPESQIEAVQQRDWLRLTKSGGNVYMLLKLSHLLGQGLYEMGAQQRGQTLEQFLQTRAGREVR